MGLDQVHSNDNCKIISVAVVTPPRQTNPSCRSSLATRQLGWNSHCSRTKDRSTDEKSARETPPTSALELLLASKSKPSIVQTHVQIRQRHPIDPSHPCPSVNCELQLARLRNLACAARDRACHPFERSRLL